MQVCFDNLLNNLLSFDNLINNQRFDWLLLYLRANLITVRCFTIERNKIAFLPEFLSKIKEDMLNSQVQVKLNVKYLYFGEERRLKLTCGG